LLAYGIVIPKVFGIDISDIDVDFFDGYLEFGISVNSTFWNTIWNLSGFPEQQPIIEYIETIESIESIQFLQ